MGGVLVLPSRIDQKKNMGEKEKVRKEWLDEMMKKKEVWSDVRGNGDDESNGIEYGQ